MLLSFLRENLLFFRSFEIEMDKIINFSKWLFFPSGYCFHFDLKAKLKTFYLKISVFKTVISAFCTRNKYENHVLEDRFLQSVFFIFFLLLPNRKPCN